MNLVSSYYSYKFIYLLTLKWEDTKQFKAGIIDKNGEPLKKFSDLSSDEKRIYDRFVRLVFSIKRMLGKVPFAQSTIGRYAAALSLIQEEYVHNIDEVFLEHLKENNLQESSIFQQINVYNLEEVYYNKKIFGMYFTEDYKLIQEELCTTGGIDMNSAPLIDKKLRRKEIEESGDDSFAGSVIFNCDSDTFQKCRLGKQKYHRYEKYVGNDEFGEKVRKYGREFPDRPIILKDSTTSAMLYLRKGK